MLTAFAAILLIVSIVFTDKARETPATGPDGLQVAHSEPLRIEATGQQWLWRYDYPNEAFSYYKLVVPVDTTVALDLVSTDVVHTWFVPDLAGKRDAVPGKNNQVVFRADEEGTFDGSSATLSGQGYAPMRTAVEVVSPEEYEAFLKSPESRHPGRPGPGRRPDQIRRNAMRAPELVVDGFPKRRARWVEIATSADHKDVGRILIVSSLGFLFVAMIELLLMRLQLAIPENTFLSPVAFNRMLSMYGATAVFLFAVPLVVGFFHYVVPLQIGARWTALPRVSQLGAWLVIAGATVLYSGFLFTPSEAGINPLPPLSELAFNANDGVDAWTSATGLATLGFVLIAIDLTTTMRRMRAPGMAWRRLPVFSWAAAIGSWLILVIGPIFLAALTMLEIDRNFDGIFFADGSGGAPLLWQHLSWIFFTGVYMLVLVAALGAIAEIVSAFARKPLFNRAATIGSLAAIAVIGTLAWMQNMLTAPIGIGWMYFAMILSLALIVPFGLILFNLIATLVGGRIRMRAPLLFAVGAISMISIGLAAEISHSLVAVAWQLKNTDRRDRRDPFRPGRRRRLRRLRDAPLLVPEDDRADDGRDPRRGSPSGRWCSAPCSPSCPLFLAGGEEGQVIDAYKFFGGTGVDAYNLIATIGSFVLATGIVLVLVNAILSRANGPEAGHDPWGGRLARVVRALAAGPAQLRRPAGRSQRATAARHPRGDLPPHAAVPRSARRRNRSR